MFENCKLLTESLIDVSCEKAKNMRSEAKSQQKTAIADESLDIQSDNKELNDV